VTLLEERLRNPVHKGGAAAGLCRAEAGNPACGDVLELRLRVEGGVVREAGFECLGSPYQQAVASVLCDVVAGLTVHAARGLGAEDVLQRIPDLPARHRHLARIGVDALRAALG